MSSKSLFGVVITNVLQSSGTFPVDNMSNVSTWFTSFCKYIFKYCIPLVSANELYPLKKYTFGNSSTDTDLIAAVSFSSATFTDSYVVLFILILIPFNYRIFNTLDAMVGYKTDELIDIGFVPAKIDDILNYIPSRIAGLFVVLSAFCLNFDYKNSYKILKRDARNCPSPNSGFTMASAAGALNIQLIKLDTYILGDNNKNIETSDIGRAVKLSKLAIFLFTVTIILFIIILYVILWK